MPYSLCCFWLNCCGVTVLFCSMNNCTQLQILALFITELNMIRLLLIVVRILIRTLVLKYCFAASTWRMNVSFVT